MEDGAPGSLDEYMRQELAVMAAGLPKPHRVMMIRGGEYYVAVSSVAGLDAALDETLAAGCSGSAIVAVALPSVTLADCAVLREAAVAGSYRGLPFVLLSAGMVDAKLAARDAVAEARRFLERERTDVTARMGARVVRHDDIPGVDAPLSARLRAAAAEYEWSNNVEKLRQEVHDYGIYIGDRLGRAVANLDAI